jgi:hypothetical protein
MRWRALTAAASLALTGFAPAAPSSDVEELVVQAKAECLPARADSSQPPPHIVSTYPANGAEVHPGVLVLRVTFDQRMTCNGAFGEVPGLKHPCPGMRQETVLSYDRKSVRMICHVVPFASYGVRIGTPPQHLFRSLAAQPAAPYVLTFRVIPAPAVATISQSLENDATAAKASAGPGG